MIRDLSAFLKYEMFEISKSKKMRDLCGLVIEDLKEVCINVEKFLIGPFLFQVFLPFKGVDPIGKLFQNFSFM